MKTGPFAEHSNQLWNISAVPSWSKVNQGLIRMYKAEVSAVGRGCAPLPRAPRCGGPVAPSSCSVLNAARGPLAGQKEAPACPVFAPKTSPQLPFLAGAPAAISHLSTRCEVQASKMRSGVLTHLPDSHTAPFPAGGGLL